MTTFVRSRRNDNVLIGFAVLVLAGISVRLVIAGSTVAAVIFGLLALGFVGLGVWLHGRPPREIRVSPAEIVYVVKGRVTGRIGHAEAGGRVTIHKQIHRGHAWFNLVEADSTTATGMPLDGFRFADGELAEALTANGWELVS